MKTRKSMIHITLTLAIFFAIMVIYISNQPVADVDLADAQRIPLLIVDAGHGGEDGGAVAQDGTMEKDINLRIALQMQALSKMFGMDCIMTRIEDEDLADHTLETIRKRKISDINARMKILQDHPDAIYIGIHQNQYSDESINGLQVFYSPNNAVSKSLAQAMQSYTAENLQITNNRNIKAAGDNIYLLYHAQLPAVMVECGFISNPDELKKLQSASYGTQISMCILGGLLNYYNAERIT